MRETDLRRHDIELRDVADADDDRCPDDMDGCVVASYHRVDDKNATYTEARCISLRLPLWTLAWSDGGTVDVADLSDREREWVQTVLDAEDTELDVEISREVSA